MVKKVEYRGFMILAGRRPGLGWCARWEEITGDVIRQAYERESEGEAIAYAKQRIDQYHKQIDLDPHVVSRG